MNTVPSIATLALQVPKVDVHCHLNGCVSPTALLELARQRGRHIDEPAVRDAFDLVSATDDDREPKFFRGLDLVAGMLRSPDDLEFVVQAFARESHAAGLRYVEMFVNPTALMRTGMSFVQVRDGLVAGARAAAADSGVTIRFIACFLREEPTDYAEAMLDELLRHRCDEFIGVGLDGPEYLPISGHDRFIDVFRRAGAAGFKRTAHLTETSPRDLITCLDHLGCDRIDHGYPVAQDPEMMARLRDSGVPVTCCLTITRDILGPLDARYLAPATHPATLLMNAGIPVTLGTDDPSFVRSDIGREYLLAAQWYGWSFADLSAMSLRGIEATWLDTVDQRGLRRSFEEELRLLHSAS
ncbi:adenosine deaminase family protein [Nocardia miyunensis]|uniref:adenosine deaminase family protein n=1 Tax=Nocardia miyunensis TaxID=282684 RepID=UPI00082C21A5|nr:hypothetical protein [Nocardia miyunensis]